MMDEWNNMVYPGLKGIDERRVKEKRGLVEELEPSQGAEACWRGCLSKNEM